MTTPRRLRRPEPKPYGRWACRRAEILFRDRLKAATYTVPAPPIPEPLQGLASWWRGAGEWYFGMGTGA